MQQGYQCSENFRADPLIHSARIAPIVLGHASKIYFSVSNVRFRPAVFLSLCHQDGRYGLRAHRPPSTRNDLGTTPPRAESTPSGSAQKRDNETHRPVKLALRRDVTDRGLLVQRCIRRGRCEACGEAAGHRDMASRGYRSVSEGPSPACRGEGAGWGILSIVWGGVFFSHRSAFSADKAKDPTV